MRDPLDRPSPLLTPLVARALAGLTLAIGIAAFVRPFFLSDWYGNDEVDRYPGPRPPPRTCHVDPARSTPPRLVRRARARVGRTLAPGERRTLSLATPRVTTIRFEVRSHRGPGGGLTELVVR